MRSPSPGSMADEVGEWVEENWAPDATVRDWWARLAAAGWAMPTWPVGLGGRALGSGEARVVGRTLAGAGVVGPPAGVGPTMGGPTVLDHGRTEQVDALVPPLADGTEAWCQLFSEPGAGSDLAGLATSAVRDGDEWVVNGQKVWNSGAHLASRGLLLARTDPSVPKHDGISYFVIDMDQPGVEVRPLRQMNGESEFCEVFLTDARVRADRMIGDPGEGWRIAQTTLAYERAGVGSSGAPTVTVVAGSLAGQLDRTCAEVIDAAAHSRRRVVSGFVVGNGALQGLARRAGRDGDPVVRQRLATFKSATEVNRFNGLRGRAALSRTGRPGPEGSIGKLAMSTIARRSRDLTFSLLGPDGMLAGDDAPGDGAYVAVALASFGASLGGGTDEIQRNVIGERTLGLPREASVDRDRPFAATEHHEDGSEG